MGLEQAMSQDPLASVGDTYPRFARNPRIACRDPGLRKRLLAELQQWRYDCRAALRRWCDHDLAVAFPWPWGAYWVPHFHGAETAAPSRAPPAA